MKKNHKMKKVNISHRIMADVLRESEHQLKKIFENVSDGMIYIDKLGRILEVNNKALHIFGGNLLFRSNYRIGYGIFCQEILHGGY